MTECDAEGVITSGRLKGSRTHLREASARAKRRETWPDLARHWDRSPV